MIKQISHLEYQRTASMVLWLMGSPRVRQIVDSNQSKDF